MLLLLGVGLVVVGFGYHSVSQVRHLLPAEALQQQRQIAALAGTLTVLAHALDHAQPAPGRQGDPAALAAIREALSATQSGLAGMRREFSFDSLTGASAAHALVNPATQDIQRWLGEGASGYGPASPPMLRLALERAVETRRELDALAARTHAAANAALLAEAERLDRLRLGLFGLTATLALLALVAVVLYVRERRARRKVALEQGRLSDALEAAGAAVALFDAQQRLLLCNRPYRVLHGLSAAALQSRPTLTDIVQRAIGSGRLVQIDGIRHEVEEEYGHRRRQPGQPFQAQWGDGRYFQVLEQSTHEGGVITFLTDISDLKLAQRRLEHLATHDSLTGLPSRRRFEAAMHAAVRRSARHGRQLATLFVDVDRFKRINDTYGHAAGDRVLRTVSRRLRTTLRDHDPVARLGGDEFAVILEDITGPEEVETTVARLHESIARPIDLDFDSVSTSVSLGIALYPTDAEDGATLLRRADDACYAAKAAGRARSRFFSPDHDRASARRGAVEHRLRSAVKDGTLQVYYQPQVAMDSRRTVGLEALLRWQDEHLGWVYPAEFVPIAEDSGLATLMLEFTAEEVCRQIRSWQSGGLVVPRTWLNVSPRHLAEVNPVLQAAVARHDIERGSLGIEITERALVDDSRQALEVLGELRENGISVAIDDFGVGYSALSRLREFPLDELKMDASFVQHLCDEEQDVELVRAIVTMAGSLNLKVIAEGVETREQMAVLEAENVRIIQGNLTGRPMPASDVTRLLQRASAALEASPASLELGLRPAGPELS
jgi:diguanylate cyclase (GGDEF)-like protein